ncbi:nucleoside/nucleotide kinase family protein [Variovorax humicola]|uniref:Nucleoside/nucleotide kinase family protein n=1 Tax=Variovorax humicola TaxID=1769758 RepID=A0ABU8W2P7_9BURK
MIQISPEAQARIESMLASGRRRLLGLVGTPGSGKSTYAAALQAAFGMRAQVVPMDGFHLANSELQRLGRADRKGAPDTFDQAGYGALLKRLRSQEEDEIVYAPEFRREIEEPIAGAIAVLPQTQLIISEGNYLLYWHAVAPLFDQVWYVEVDEALRRERLVRRHEQFGRSPEAAREWVAATDEPNARLIESRRARANHIVRLGG